jgi:hypothetical protein
MDSKRRPPEKKPPPKAKRPPLPADAFLESQNGMVIEHIADGPDDRDDPDRARRED